MAVVSIKNKLRRGNLLVGNNRFIPPAFESIATYTVGSGGAANVEFTSIPADYAHLQIRGMSKDTTAGTGVELLYLQFNSDTGNNYATHRLEGNGTSASAGANTSTSAIRAGVNTQANSTDIFAATIIDILDYANTNKYTTTRSLTGADKNGSGEVAIRSGVWMNTNAVTSIKLTSNVANLAQYSHFALYGIKGA
jgi:hypothetical protein